MSDPTDPQPDVPTGEPSEADAPAPPPYAPPPPPAPAGGVPAPAPAGQVPAMAPIGKVRNTGTCFLLMIVTLGFYSWYWYFATHDEMKRHSGNGIGGGIALLLAILVSVVMPFLSSNEVGGLYERRGQARPVSAVTGLWYLLLGWFFFVGAIVWFVKTNRALNEYWQSLGAQ